MNDLKFQRTPQHLPPSLTSPSTHCTHSQSNSSSKNPTPQINKTKEFPFHSITSLCLNQKQLPFSLLFPLPLFLLLSPHPSILMTSEWYSRKSGQIPAFGDWENANQLPITQYFECARQAGLMRCSCSGVCPYVNNSAAAVSWGGTAGGDGGDLYDVGFYEKPLPRRVHAAPQRKTRTTNKSYSHSKEQRKQVKVRDLMDQPIHQPLPQKHYPKPRNKPENLTIPQQRPSVTIKPVDEDLYRISPELLENPKRKKMLGFFSRCMVRPCAT